jgi:hypothetical protein
MTAWTTRLAGLIRPLKRTLVLGLALLLSLGLAACDGTTSMKDAAKTAVSVARTAADVTGNEQLKSVLDPVLAVLNTSERQVKTGDVAAAGGSLKTFQALWDTARPVVKLAAGPNYGLIDKGVKLLTTTFGGDTAPSKDNALAAITGLIKPLSALLG